MCAAPRPAADPRRPVPLGWEGASHGARLATGVPGAPETLTLTPRGFCQSEDILELWSSVILLEMLECVNRQEPE